MNCFPSRRLCLVLLGGLLRVVWLNCNKNLQSCTDRERLCTQEGKRHAQQADLGIGSNDQRFRKRHGSRGGRNTVLFPAATAQRRFHARSSYSTRHDVAGNQYTKTS